MKTTLDLPDELMRAVKVRAAQRNRRIKDVVADLLTRALSLPPVDTPQRPRRVRLPLVQCDVSDEATPERVAWALIDQEVEFLSGPMMLLCDANVWLSLALSGHVHHRLTVSWLERIDESGVIHFCRATQQSFLRLLTNRTVLGAYGRPPLSNSQAWAAYAAFLADDRIVLADREPVGLEGQWKAFATRSAAAPKVWMDAYLAAFALTGGFELVTLDSDFT